MLAPAYSCTTGLLTRYRRLIGRCPCDRTLLRYDRRDDERHGRGRDRAFLLEQQTDSAEGCLGNTAGEPHEFAPVIVGQLARELLKMRGIGTCTECGAGAVERLVDQSSVGCGCITTPPWWRATLALEFPLLPRLSLRTPWAAEQGVARPSCW